MDDYAKVCMDRNSREFDNINNRLCKIDETLADIGIILAKTNTILESQSITLNEHTRRSLASENRLDVLEKTYYKVVGAFKFVMVLATVSGLIVAGFNIYNFFK